MGSSWQYDADGRLLSGANAFNTYDAAGHTIHVEIPSTYSSHATLGLDGDGRQVKTEETTWDEGSQTEVTETKYYLRSSVLGGQVLTEISAPTATRTFVYAGPVILAWHPDASDYKVNLAHTKQVIRTFKRIVEIVFIWLVAFTLASLVVDYFWQRRKGYILFWEAVGVIAVAAWNVFALLGTWLDKQTWRQHELFGGDLLP